jgi:hypothetical protein
VRRICENGSGLLLQALRGNENSHFKMPTLQTRDWKGISGRSSKGMERDLPTAVGCKAGGPLNPDWCEWFMNWPVGWTSTKELNGNEIEYWKTASSTDVCGQRLREMWFNKEAGAPSLGQESDEQRSGERYGRVFCLPPQGAQEDSLCSMFSLRKDVHAEAIEESEAVREFRMQQDSRQEISRLAVGIVNRVDRISALGNGQVPAVVRLAWETLA